MADECRSGSPTENVAAVVMFSWRALRLDIEGHDLSLLSGELHPDQMNRFAGGSVLVSIAAGLDLLQRLALGQLFHHLELEQVEMAEGRHGHVDPAVMTGVFHGDVETQCSEVAVDMRRQLLWPLGDN